VLSLIFPPFDSSGTQFDHGKVAIIHTTSVYTPVRFDQVNAIGILQPDPAAVGYKVIMRFEAHASTFCRRTVGHAPQVPLFQIGFLGAFV